MKAQASIEVYLEEGLFIHQGKPKSITSREQKMILWYYRRKFNLWLSDEEIIDLHFDMTKGERERITDDMHMAAEYLTIQEIEDDLQTLTY